MLKKTSAYILLFYLSYSVRDLGKIDGVPPGAPFSFRL
jgi:hypothetical protein